MKLSINCLLFLCILLFSVSCKEQKKVDAGVIDTKENVYQNDEIGWKIAIPEGWRIMTVSQRDAMNERGKAAIEETIDSKLDVSGLKNLLGFQKDRFNIFGSTSEPFIEEYPGEWVENNSFLKETVLETYQQNGVHANASETSIEKISGIDFYVYSIKVFLPNDITLTQYMYSSLINGLDFGVNINYTNEKYGEEMLKAFRESTFTKVSN